MLRNPSGTPFRSTALGCRCTVHHNDWRLVQGCNASVGSSVTPKTFCQEDAERAKPERILCLGGRALERPLHRKMSCKIVHRRATFDEGGQYSFASCHDVGACARCRS